MEIHKLDISDAQKRKLLNGHAIQIKHHQIGSGSHVVLDTAHGKKVRTAYRTGKGVRIQLANDHVVRSNVIHGSGFSSMLSKAKKKALQLDTMLSQNEAYNQLKSTAKDKAKQYAQDAIQKGKELALNKVSQYTENLDPSLRDTLRNGATDMINLQSAKASQFIEGQGFGKDLLKGLKTVAKVAAPVVLNTVAARTGLPVNTLTPMVQQALGSGVKKRGGRARKTAGALIPSGY